MSKVLLIALIVFLSGFLLCFIISIPLIVWVIHKENREKGIIPERIPVREVGIIPILAIVLSVFWVLMLPLYGLMLLEKIAGKDGKKE